MAITLYPTWKEDAEVTLLDPSVDQRWMLLGAGTDPADVYVALGLGLPSSYRGLYLEKYEPKHLGAGVWEIMVHYGRNRPLLPDVIQFSAKTSGGTIHRETTLGRRVYYREASDVPSTLLPSSTSVAITTGGPTVDFPSGVYTTSMMVFPVAATNNCIGVTRHGVEGVDVDAPVFAFTVSKRFFADLVPPGFLQLLYAATARVNNGPFAIVWKGQILIFNAGECKYKGSSISDEAKDVDGREMFTVGYEFEASPNVENLPVGGFLINKGGWEYVWIYYRDTVDGNVMLKKPMGIFVETTYYTANFGLLGI